MNENKCCGNCKHFKDEDAEGDGCCEKLKQLTHCSFKCHHHEFRNNGWTEITPDNEHEVAIIPPERLMIAVMHRGNPEYMEYSEMFHNLDTMAKHGDYFYYVLPELKIE